VIGELENIEICYILFYFKFLCLFLHVIRRRQTVLIRGWKQLSFIRRQIWSELPKLLMSSKLVSFRGWIHQNLLSSESSELRLIRVLMYQNQNLTFKLEFNHMVLHIWTHIKVPSCYFRHCYHQNLWDIVLKPILVQQQCTKDTLNLTYLLACKKTVGVWLV